LFNLIARFFDRLAAYGTPSVLKVLELLASLVFAIDHDRTPAGIATLVAHKGLATAKRAECLKGAAAGRTHGQAALDGLQALGALIPKGAAASTAGT